MDNTRTKYLTKNPNIDGFKLVTRCYVDYPLATREIIFNMPIHLIQYHQVINIF